MGPLDMLDPLQLRFTELCIEKRRMLNEMSDLEGQARRLGSEIHRLLDCFMELVPIDQYLADDDYSDGEVSEFGAAEKALSEYGFLGDSDEEELIEEDRAAFEHWLVKNSAMHHHHQHQHHRSPKRRHSKSPRRRGHTAAAASNALPDKDKPEYPIVVGRAINRIMIHSLGRLVSPPPPWLGEEDLAAHLWHPRGFESKRKYYDFDTAGATNSTPKRTNYVCRIDETGAFSISMDSTKASVVAGDNPEQVWACFVEKFPPSLADSIRLVAEGLAAALLCPIQDSPAVAPDACPDWELFNRASKPSISLPDYIFRIVSHINPDRRILKSLVLYKRRLFRLKGLQLDELCVHRFVLVGVVVGSKALVDDRYKLSYYARVGGVSVRELCALEMAFCRLLDWQVFCLNADLEQVHIY